MIAFLNGRFVPEMRAVVSVFDRGFLYGDGVFETLRVFRGRPFCWAQHFERFAAGAAFLRIAMPATEPALRAAVGELIERNAMPDCVARLVLSRGPGVRGYSPKGAGSPTLVASLHPAPALDCSAPPRRRVIISSLRIPTNDPLARYKTTNKLHQVLARAEADAAAVDDALMLNTDGCVVEASGANLFWCAENGVCTPPLESGILAGVTRSVVIGLCRDLGIPVQETNVSPEGLLRSKGVFLSTSSVGIAEVVAIEAQPLHHSPVVSRLYHAYLELVGAETAKA